MQNSRENINDYFQYTVITKIEYVNENPMALPAFTLCLVSSKADSNNLTLDKSLYNCSISGTVCDTKDFYSFELFVSYNNALITCYVLNGGRNSTGHSSDIIATKNTGPFTGFSLAFFLRKDHFFYYYINDAYIKPTTSDNIKFLLPGTSNVIILEKTVETKLEYPFNNCWNLGNMPDTPLVRQLSAGNITYRQVNCFELCFQNFVQNYAWEQGISEDDARGKDEVKNYDEEKDCNHLCPLECESTQYKIFESKSQLAATTDIEKYSKELIPKIEKKLNITINSKDEFNQNYLELFVFFDSLQYTKISQTPKTTLSALISNLGGSTGLFLDLSFISVCRAIEFFLGIIFKI